MYQNFQKFLKFQKFENSPTGVDFEAIAVSTAIADPQNRRQSVARCRIRQGLTENRFGDFPYLPSILSRRLLKEVNGDPKIDGAGNRLAGWRI